MDFSYVDSFSKKFKAFVIRHTVIDLICSIFLYFLACHNLPCRLTERSIYIFITVLNVILKAKLFYFNEPTVTLVCFYVKLPLLYAILLCFFSSGNISK